MDALKKSQQDGKQIKRSISGLVLFFSFLRKRTWEGKMQSLGYLDNEGGKMKKQKMKKADEGDVPILLQ